MGRTGIMLAFAVVGFFLGVGLYWLGVGLGPYLKKLLPALAQTGWIIAGLIGALITVILLLIWSYTSKT
jgi:apolipoprotein N-acyltransferase